MISILMPVYNGIEFMETSVHSVLEQTHKEWELLIGINGHPPGSEVYQIAKTYEKDPRIRVLDLLTKGKSNTLNELLNHCTYDWIALLDVDDIWLPKKLEKQSRRMLGISYLSTSLRVNFVLTQKRQTTTRKV